MSSSSPGGETAASHPDAATVREENCGAQGSGGGEAGTVWEFQTADPAVRTLSSSSAFLATADAKDGDAEEAIHSGVLEKATKDASSWKVRRCALHADAFWYSKGAAGGASDATIPSGSRWTCIPLSTCVQLMRSPQDGKVFLVQTASRSYYWRAQSQSEAEAWLLSIGTQCAALKELELLQQAEERLIQTEEAHTDSCVSSLPFANRQSLSPRYPGSVLGTMVTDVRTIMQNIVCVSEGVVSPWLEGVDDILTLVASTGSCPKLYPHVDRETARRGKAATSGRRRCGGVSHDGIRKTHWQLATYMRVPPFHFIAYNPTAHCATRGLPWSPELGDRPAKEPPHCREHVSRRMRSKNARDC
ncbi:uncharacterized protein LOC34618785 [Cyclospora cayetanensis]|uniref:Uncharacterized protein LOC34618785 n=1 Tax=Cyclospora cayetanensis TaxID=88456 RepID=A0A6P6S0T7_9EIME|nr:uncharacterized protein LOC34618785 [Cyclospora cayetanensis]